MTESSSGNSSASLRRFFRPSLRQATLIIPQTGERVRRAVTLSSSESERSHESLSDTPGEQTPLIRRRRTPIRPHQNTTVRRYWEHFKNGASSFQRFVVSDTGKGVLKCSLAYFLGSLATFLPPLSAFLGQQDGKHMVATITVYFHPSRSRGSMFEALICSFAAFLYAAFVSVTSMAVSVFFGDTLDLMPLGHALVLIIFVGGGLGYIGWTKQRLGDPLVNTACSLASISLITILTKEGAVQAADFSFAKITQVLKMLVMGIIATMAVSFLIFPISAKNKLRQNIIDVTDSLSDLLVKITHSFLSGYEEDLEQKSFLDATDRHRKVFSSLAKNLKEAKYEHYVAGTEKQCILEARLVQCIQRVTQSIGGLRSAAAMQFALIEHVDLPSISTLAVSSTVSTPFGMRSASTFSEDFGLAAIEERDEEETQNGEPGGTARKHTFFQSPAEIFGQFIGHLGPSMRSLAYTMKEILDELPYGPGPDFKINVNPKFRGSLTQAISLYSNSRKEALKDVYDKKDIDLERSPETQADFEEVAASCGHFSFSLLEFAEQLKEYLDILDELQLEVEELPTGRSWEWLKFWRSGRVKPDSERRDSSDLLDRVNDINQQINATPIEPRPLLASDPEKVHTREKIGYRIWRALRLLRRDDTKFAFKVGVGATLYALPAFIPSTRPIYSHWRGEWGLLSYMLVCSMTVGASNTTSFARIFGTCLGALCAIVAWQASFDNPFMLAFLGWIMAYWTAYIIVGRGQGPMGRFIMLTYNLSALYAYSLSVKDEDHDEDEGGINPIITDITLHRVVAVISGCLWGMIVTRLIWPISARQKLKDGLSLIWLRMGLIWKRNPLSMIFLEGGRPDAIMNLREEFELQRFMSFLEGVHSAAKSEFELRGPFPAKAYDRILKSTGRMIDAFHAMNMVILKDLNATEGEKELLKYTIRERAQLASRISHLFSVLASSMKLEYPLNDALPNTEHTRDRLLAKIFNYRKYEQAKSTTTDEDFGLLYAYALVTGQLSQEIKIVLKEIEGLFGVLNEDLLKLD